MERGSSVICSQIVAGVLIFYYFAIGILLTRISLSNRSSSYAWILIVSAIAHISLGILLLVGALKDKKKCILAYLVITTPFLIFATFRSFSILCETAGVAHEIICTFLLILFLMWTVHYFVYAFYKYLSDKNKKLASGENAEVALAGNNGNLAQTMPMQPIKARGQNGT